MVGKRSYQNTLALFRDLSDRMNLEVLPLITTDGFGFYEKVIGRAFGPGSLYGQVIKTRRNDRIVKVERRIVVRQGSAYLGCRTICQARWKECLEDHLELFRCHYNFIRPHRALNFGRDVRTPAMQAGLTRQQLMFREIFQAGIGFLASKNVLFAFFGSARRSVSLPGECLWRPSNI